VSTFRFIPTGSVRVADKKSDAVAYLYTGTNGKPSVRVFFGKQSKPVSAYYYRTDAEREAAVTRAFEARRASVASKAEQQAARSIPIPLKAGDILNTCWGYDQTNREFFEVIKRIGKRDVILRELAQERVTDGWERGRCVPLPGEYIGEAIRRRANSYGVRIDRCRMAFPSDTDTVGGVRVVKPVYWTSYA
jgi:hypothetical protein